MKRKFNKNIEKNSDNKKIKLDLSHQTITDTNTKKFDQIISAIKYQGITKLSLSNTKITSSAIKAIATAMKTNSTITELNLSGNPIDKEGIQSIANIINNDKLTKLNLAYTKIRARDMPKIGEALMKRKTPIELNLSDNLIGKTGVKIIANTIKNNKISKIILSRNKINNIKEIAEALEENKTVKALELVCNHINNDESVANLVKILINNHSLNDINLDGIEFNRENSFKIVNAFSKNKFITHFNCNSITPFPDYQQKINQHLSKNQKLLQLINAFKITGPYVLLILQEMTENFKPKIRIPRPLLKNILVQTFFGDYNRKNPDNEINQHNLKNFISTFNPK